MQDNVQVKVSLCVIAYNEEDNICTLFNNLIQQDYPHELVEIVLVDGNSSDKTRSLMEDLNLRITALLALRF